MNLTPATCAEQIKHLTREEKDLGPQVQDLILRNDAQSRKNRDEMI